MAANADTPAEELSVTAQTTMPTSPGQPEPSSERPNHDDAERTSAAQLEESEAMADEAQDDDDGVDPGEDDAKDAAARPTSSQPRRAIVVGVMMVVVLVALAGWLGFRAHQSYSAHQQRQLFVQVGRQGALNLTTIDWQHADSDTQRILASATGAFYDDFSKRQQPFIDLVKKMQSKTDGTVTEAGLESASADNAQVLVAVSVKTSNNGVAEQQPRAYRMRISVQKNGDEAKVSNVEFVP